jgi:hypothetical protein
VPADTHARRDRNRLLSARSPDEAAILLDRAAARIAAHGTRGEAPLLAAMATLAGPVCPGAAAALTDRHGTEVARLRAFGIVHGAVLAVLAARAAAAYPGRTPLRNEALAG